MTPYIQIEWMSSSLEEARVISQKLIQKQLVACANIIENVHSYYMWEGDLASSQEVKVILKSHMKYFETIANFITTQASYEVPAIIVIPILKANGSYLKWLEDTLKPDATI